MIYNYKKYTKKNRRILVAANSNSTTISISSRLNELIVIYNLQEQKLRKLAARLHSILHQTIHPQKSLEKAFY